MSKQYLLGETLLSLGQPKKTFKTGKEEILCNNSVYTTINQTISSPNHFFSQPFKAEKPRLWDLLNFLQYACGYTVLVNLFSKSKQLSIFWVQNMKVLHNRPYQTCKHVTKPCMSKTCCQVLHQTNPFSGHCCILSSPVRQVLSWLCRTCTAPPTPLQTEQQCHKDFSPWGHLNNQARNTESTEGRQQKAQRASEFPKVAWTAQNPSNNGWILTPVLTACLWDFLFPFPLPKLNLLFDKFFQYFPPLTHSGSIPM